VAGYAHVFILLSVVTVPYPNCVSLKLVFLHW